MVRLLLWSLWAGLNRNFSQPTQLHNESPFMCFNESLPNITVYATGGTIAGYASSPYQTIKYESGIRNITTVIIERPEICKTANIRPVQLANEDSIEQGLKDFILWSKQIQRDLDNPHTQGVVLPTGSDRLSELARVLAMTTNGTKPVVVTGAMRPATAANADGPGNILDSVLVVINPDARDHKVMIVFAGRILPPAYTIKFNSKQENAFESRIAGDIGMVEDGKVQFFFKCSQPPNQPYFDLRKISLSEELPPVEMVDAETNHIIDLKPAIDRGTKGIFVNGFGGGHVPTAIIETIKNAVNGTDIPVLVSSRVTGFVRTHKMDFAIAAGILPSSHAHIQFQLALWMGLSPEMIRKSFDCGGNY